MKNGAVYLLYVNLPCIFWRARARRLESHPSDQMKISKNELLIFKKNIISRK